MIFVNKNLTSEEIGVAKAVELRRTKCKSFLATHGLSFDKFTIVGHDSFIGFVSEIFVKEYIIKNYSDKIVSVESWDEQYDLARIDDILSSNRNTNEDILYMREYFYDKYDLRINKSYGPPILLDIKTAITAKTPSSNWNFMYPVVQAHKSGKDIMLLVYYVVKDVSKPETLQQIAIVGATHEATIRQCDMIPQGTRTRFGTMSQIDNYETLLNTHYQDISLLFQ